jgi:hypothetical protein
VCGLIVKADHASSVFVFHCVSVIL